MDWYERVCSRPIQPTLLRPMPSVAASSEPSELLPLFMVALQGCAGSGRGACLVEVGRDGCGEQRGIGADGYEGPALGDPGRRPGSVVHQQAACLAVCRGGGADPVQCGRVEGCGE